MQLDTEKENPATPSCPEVSELDSTYDSEKAWTFCSMDGFLIKSEPQDLWERAFSFDKLKITPECILSVLETNIRGRPDQRWRP